MLRSTKPHEPTLKVICFVSIRVIPFRDISWIIFYSPQENCSEF
jgi:hypothetical protein